MSMYLGAISGGMVGISVSVGLSSADAALFLMKMNELEKIESEPPDFSNYENLIDRANDLDNLKTLAEGVQAARKLHRLKTELQALKDLKKIKATKAGMATARASVVDAARSLGWAIFESAEDTGQIAEQSAVLSIKFTGLKYLNLSLVKIIEDAEDGIDNNKEARNIFLLHMLKSKRFQLKGDLAATLLESYRERKSAISGYMGRFVLYVQGKSVDEQKVEQAIRNLEHLVTLELDDYFEVKINTDVSTALAIQRASL